VADGDLTVQATVSEDITGAIADSVNYTVEELRGLVGRVTATAEQVTKASTHAQSISSDLLAASQQQSREIQDASSTVVKMANEITDVSRSASESADVARQSVAAARRVRRRWKMPSRACTRSASRFRIPPSASSGWANRRRRLARSPS
jgi:twitching motility protein PilJ